MPTDADHEPDCESCGRDAEVTVDFPHTTFRLCLRCVPAELRSQVVAIPGNEQHVDLMLGFLAAHQQPAPPAPAAASTR